MSLAVNPKAVVPVLAHEEFVNKEAAEGAAARSRERLL
jgi:hypothetical protein